MKKILLSLPALALLGAGCWNSATPVDTAAPVAIMNPKFDSCVIFTKADAEAVLGVKVLDPMRNGAMSDDGNTTVSSCNYPSPAEDPAEVKVVGLLVRKAANAAEADKVYMNARAESKSLSGVDAVDVSGLGDKAYWSGGRLTQLNVLNGEAWLIINVQDKTNKNLQAQATEAARRALAKMK